MEIEQLLSVIRSEVSKLHAYQYMDEALTAVTDAKGLADKAAKDVEASKAQVEQAKTELADLQKQHAVELAEFSLKCDDLMSQAKAKAEVYVAEQQSIKADLQKQCDELVDLKNRREVAVQQVQQDHVIVSANLQAVSDEYERVKAALASIKASL